MNMTRYYLVRGCILAALLLGLLWAIQQQKKYRSGNQWDSYWTTQS